MDLTSDDVQEILQLLDGLPFGEMHLQTPRFSLWLRRSADGEWTQELQILSEPAIAKGAARSAEAAGAAAAGEARAPGVAADAGVAGAGEAGTPGMAGERRAADAAAGAAGLAAGTADRDGLRAVRAPLPGTFYRAPAPGAPPFVEVGTRVQPDTVVGIVETMKLMNSVPAGVAGTVAEIVLANAGFAERDAVLMRIREEP